MVTIQEQSAVIQSAVMDNLLPLLPSNQQLDQISQPQRNMKVCHSGMAHSAPRETFI